MDSSTAKTLSAIDYSAIFVVLVTLCAFFAPVLVLFPPFPPSRRDALLQTHSKLGVNAAVGKKPASGTSPKAESQPGKIRSLWIYPIKSCRGIELARAKVIPQGLEFDRLFTFAQLKSPFPVGSASSVEEKSGHRWEFMTQRQFPLLATVRVDLFVPDADKCRDQPVRSGEAFVVLSFPWQEAGLRGTVDWLAAKVSRGFRALPEKEVLLPVEFPSREDIEERGYSCEPVRIWRDTVDALNLERELPPELRLYLGVSNRLALFRVDPERLREVFRCAPRESEAGYQPVTGFQDAYPLHLLNLNSVRDLDSKVTKDEEIKDLDFRRFRANIIVDGPPPYDEDTWKSIRFLPDRGSSSAKEPSAFHVSCRTVRCKLPNVDQDTGSRHPVEPDKSLRQHRDVDEGAPHLGCLGMQLCPLFSETELSQGMESWVQVGMGIEVLERGKHVYIRQ